MTFFDGLRSLIDDLVCWTDDDEVEVVYPRQSPLAGSVAGRYLIRRDVHGHVRYDWKGAPDAVLHEQLSELVVRHLFDHIEHMALSFRVMDAANCEVFVFSPERKPATVAAVIDRRHPEKGLCEMVVARHPRWLRWFSALGRSDERDLTHGELVDLLLDNSEDLDDEMVAKSYQRFRSAREVIYDADLGGTGHVGVKAKWKGSKGKDAEVEDLTLPDEFTALLPAYVGVWPGGDEPRHTARFTIRIIPPKSKDEVTPMFRVRWANLSDYELMAREALFAAVKDAFGDLPDGVYLGSPNVVRYVLPEPTTDED